VARTKFLAKVASTVAKPDGLLVVQPDEELGFLHPLPVEALWGVGPITARKLRDHGVAVVRQVAELDEATLVRWLGRASGRTSTHSRTTGTYVASGGGRPRAT
jgi:DNA polymerase-4